MENERYYWYKSHGICPGCGQNKAVKGKVYCISCAEAQAALQMARRARMTDEQHREEVKRITKLKQAQYFERKAHGICTVCGKKPAESGRTRCKRCAEKNREWARMKYARRDHG